VIDRPGKRIQIRASKDDRYQGKKNAHEKNEPSGGHRWTGFTKADRSGRPRTGFKIKKKKRFRGYENRESPKNEEIKHQDYTDAVPFDYVYADEMGKIRSELRKKMRETKNSPRGQRLKLRKRD